MNRCTLGAAVLGLAACGCSPQLSRRQQAIEEQVVLDRLSAWVRTVNRRELDTLATFYEHSPDLTVTWSNGRRTRGWQQESALQRETLAALTAFNFVIQDQVVDVIDPTAAISTSRFSIDQTARAGRELYSGHQTLIWIKDAADGRWKIRAAHTSRNPPPSDAAARLPRKP